MRSKKYIIIISQDDENENKIELEWPLQNMWTLYPKDKTVGELLERVKRDYQE